MQYLQKLCSVSFSPSGVGRRCVLCDDGALAQLGVEIHLVVPLFEQLPLDRGLVLVSVRVFVGLSVDALPVLVKQVPVVVVVNHRHVLPFTLKNKHD